MCHFSGGSIVRKNTKSFQNGLKHVELQQKVAYFISPWQDSLPDDQSKWKIKMAMSWSIPGFIWSAESSKRHMLVFSQMKVIDFDAR